MKALIDLRPLRTTPDFRRLWLGNTLSGIGGQLTVVAVLYQAWTVTDSAFAVGLVGLTQAIPMVVFGLVGGTLADSVDRRRLVLATTVGQTVVAGLLAAQAVAGLDSFGVLLGLVAALATCQAIGAPARRTFAVRLLPSDQLAAGLALNQLGFQVAMLAGPAAGGLIIAGWGVEACYLVDALTFVAAGYGVLRLPSMRPQGKSDRPGVRAIWSSWRLIGRLPALRGALATDIFATVLAMPVALFPVVNDERFGGDPETLGLFFSAVAVGGVTAGAASGLATRTPRAGRTMLFSAALWGLGLAGFGLAQELWLALACLAIAGAADMISVVSRATIVQLATPDSYRGRVSGVEHIIGVAGPDVGNFRGGLVAGASSASFALVSGGLLCAFCVAVLGVRNRPLRRFTVSEQASEPEPEPTS